MSNIFNSKYYDENRKFEDTWYVDMTDIEKDIYFCRATIFSALCNEECTKMLICTSSSGSSLDNFVTVHTFDSDRIHHNLEKLKELTGCNHDPIITDKLLTKGGYKR